jgi:hypothetical protein
MQYTLKFFWAYRKQHKIAFVKQEGHDDPEITHLYIGLWAMANFKPVALI